MIKLIMYMQFVALALVAVPQQSTALESEGLTVVELFTSQACNSCPPADALANELAERDNVLVLSWNVDYWDYLGWQDTLAKPEYTQRQWAYNRSLGRNRVFTPQMVIGGRKEVVGSNRSDVEKAIRDKDNRAASIGVTYHEDTVTITLPGDVRVTGATVTIVHFEFQQEVPIASGENGGRSITYAHPVAKTYLVGVWNGEVTEYTISRERFCDKGNAVLVQAPDTGPILAAAIVDIAAN